MQTLYFSLPTIPNDPLLFAFPYWDIMINSSNHLVFFSKRWVLN